MNRVFRLCSVLLPLLAAGCGGGGSQTVAGDRTAAVAVFATDSFRDDFDQVWVSIHKVELLDSAGIAETVFNDDEGRVLELRSLRDAAGERFELLGEGRVRPGMYSSVRVTIGDSFSAVPKNGSDAQAIPVAADVPRDGQGHPVVQFPLQNPRNLSGPGGSVVVDFDLANFVLAGGRLRPSLREAISQLLPNGERHERNHFNGVVAELTETSTGSAFLLRTGHNHTLHVAVVSETVILNADGTPNAELANGQRVRVEGRFNLGSRTFDATEIRIEPRGHDESRRGLVVGSPVRADAGAGTIVVHITRVEGFHPRSREIVIHTTETTVFHDRSGLPIRRAAFFEIVLDSRLIKASGIYNRESNTFTAHHVRLGEDEHRPRHVRALGTPVEVNADHRSFMIHPLTEWGGFTPRERRVNVVTTHETVFKNREGRTISAADFFHLLRESPAVLVEGRYDRENNSITAAAAVPRGA